MRRAVRVGVAVLGGTPSHFTVIPQARTHEGCHCFLGGVEGAEHPPSLVIGFRLSERLLQLRIEVHQALAAQDDSSCPCRRCLDQVANLEAERFAHLLRDGDLIFGANLGNFLTHNSLSVGK